MAGKTHSPAPGGGIDALFNALEALTWREMNEVAGLVAIQLETHSVPEGDVARALADAAESWREADDE